MFFYFFYFFGFLYIFTCIVSINPRIDFISQGSIALLDVFFMTRACFGLIRGSKEGATFVAVKIKIKGKVRSRKIRL